MKNNCFCFCKTEHALPKNQPHPPTHSHAHSWLARQKKQSLINPQTQSPQNDNLKAARVPPPPLLLSQIPALSLSITFICNNDFLF